MEKHLIDDSPKNPLKNKTLLLKTFWIKVLQKHF